MFNYMVLGLNKKIPFDIIGDIAILKFPSNYGWLRKKLIARKFLKQNKRIVSVLEKTGKFKGRLRKQETEYLAGVKKKDTIYIENNCRFYFDVDETYFSPRLSEQRKNIAEEIVKKVTKNKNKIMVMFAGVAPFPIVIADKLKKSNKKAEVISNELNRKASEYAEKNVKLNKLEDYIKVIQGDSRKIAEDLKKKNYKADFIVMPRPNLDDTFLDACLLISKKGTKIYYYGFGTKDKVLKEVGKIKNKIKNIKIEKAGDIGPYEFRWLVRFEIR
ncbi:MAG: hypothetical protein ACOCUI_04585 [bacterium]